MATATGYNYVDLGQANLSGDTEALFRDVFQPLLLTTFDEKRVMAHLVRHKQIEKGKSASFPLFGGIQSAYLAKGYEVDAFDVAKNEQTIYVDPWLYTAVYLDELEEKMSETDDRTYLIKQMAQELANKEDRQLLQVGVLAARSGSLITGENRGGSVIKAGADVMTDPDVILDAILAAGVEFDNKDVPENDRFIFIRPQQYAVLIKNKLIIDKDTGNGSLPKGVVGQIDNFNIVKTNHLPSTNITYSGTTPKNTYGGDFTKTAMLALQREALATVDFKGLMTEVSRRPKSFDYLITTRIAQGHGFLRPECAVEISSAEATSGSGS